MKNVFIQYDGHTYQAQYANGDKALEFATFTEEMSIIKLKALGLEADNIFVKDWHNLNGKPLAGRSNLEEGAK